MNLAGLHEPQICQAVALLSPQKYKHIIALIVVTWLAWWSRLVMQHGNSTSNDSLLQDL